MAAPKPFLSRNVDLPQLGPNIRIHYLYSDPTDGRDAPLGTFLLCHGFPQSSYHYRHAIPLLAAAGYRVVAPDLRGQGKSSKPPIGPESDFRKTVLAHDLYVLLYEEIGVPETEPIHTYGYDIGAFVAHAFAARYPERTKSTAWGEAPLPGTKAYYWRRGRTDHFHLSFHNVPDLPELLIKGNEVAYMRYFFDRQAYNRRAISQADLDEYVGDYTQPGAIRCGLGLYRAFETDAEENVELVKKEGKCKVPALAFSGARSIHTVDARMGMVEEMYETVEQFDLPETGHYIAEESPEGFATKMIEWAGRWS
uniref:AB hydrolase-1 domain-containing protein n=1 Tax=Mycena chlorophos TaxID=658473 RepID=A0ABQ0LPS6_MYCCL|nr:predicted protein [Mycena chlorophos]